MKNGNLNPLKIIEQTFETMDPAIRIRAPTSMSRIKVTLHLTIVYRY
jgi:hypothetical protein